MENVAQESKYQSMYLQTLPHQKNTKINFHKAPKSLITQDIDGARARYIQRPIKPRQTFYNRNDDIQKSHSRCLIPRQTNKTDKQLFVDDIQGTRTKVNKFTTLRKTNPLNPHYQLSQIILATVPQPKFIKDSLQIDDIQGTRTKETFIRHLERNGKILQKQPIQYNIKSKKPKPKTNNYLLDVSDINMKQKDKIFKGQRCSNPLDPVYTLQTQNKNENSSIQCGYGFIQGSKPSNPKAHITNPNYCMDVKDIAGTMPKTRKFVPSSKQLEVTGSKPESLKRGISTNRKTDPLQPKYSYLGGSEQLKSAYSRPKTAVQRFDAFIS